MCETNNVTCVSPGAPTPTSKNAPGTTAAPSKPASKGLSTLITVGPTTNPVNAQTIAALQSQLIQACVDPNTIDRTEQKELVCSDTPKNSDHRLYTHFPEFLSTYQCLNTGDINFNLGLYTPNKSDKYSSFNCPTLFLASSAYLDLYWPQDTRFDSKAGESHSDLDIVLADPRLTKTDKLNFIAAFVFGSFSDVNPGIIMGGIGSLADHFPEYKMFSIIQGYAKQIGAITTTYSVTVKVDDRTAVCPPITVIRLGNDMRIVFPYYAQVTLPEGTAFWDADAVAEFVLNRSVAEDHITNAEIISISNYDSFNTDGTPKTRVVWTPATGYTGR